MTDHNYIIPAESRDLLASLCGRKLVNIEGYRYDLSPENEKTTFYAVTRLHMEDGCSYDLRVRLTRIDISGNFWDEVGVYSFGYAKGDIWLPDNTKTFKISIGKEIDAALLVNDFDVLRYGGEKAGTFAFTKAVLLRTGLEYIAFSMDDFCEDSIIVCRGFDPEELVPDGGGSWYDEPGWTDDYERRFETL